MTRSGEGCSLGANWWLFALRGLLGIVFGCLAVFIPLATILAMALVLGAYVLVDGIFQLVSGINQAHRGERWGGLVLSGMLGIEAGLFLLLAPHLASVGLTLLLWTTLAAWAFASGLTLAVTAARLRREIQEEWLMPLNGAVLMLLGLAVLLLFWSNPAASTYTLAFLVSLAALSCGGVNLALAYKLFRLDHPVPAKAAP
jgi:uncharacterized membrane protein HdeD (DUF308 family)